MAAQFSTGRGDHIATPGLSQKWRGAQVPFVGKYHFVKTNFGATIYLRDMPRYQASFPQGSA